MLIRTVVLLSLQHKLKQKYASAKNRISVKFITWTKQQSMQLIDIICRFLNCCTIVKLLYQKYFEFLGCSYYRLQNAGNHNILRIIFPALFPKWRRIFTSKWKIRKVFAQNWMDQPHGCSDKDLNCNFVLQYRCQDDEKHQTLNSHSIRNGKIDSTF